MTTKEWWIDEDGDYLIVCEGNINEFGEREEVAVLHRNRPSLAESQPANARLIAAAPELLAALKVAWLRNSNHERMTFDECVAARAAIEKAQAEIVK